MKDKTEFLFESDAEKAVLNQAIKNDQQKLKRKKLRKAIIRNSVLLAIITIGITYGVFKHNSGELAATAFKKNYNDTTDESFNKYANKLKAYNGVYQDKYEILINKNNTVDKDDLNEYELVSVKDNLYDDVILEKEAYDEYVRLRTNLNARGYYINIINGYESFSNKGTSEHNVGLAIDIVITNKKDTVNSIYDSTEYSYLTKIAYLYGYIIRYPKGKERTTGHDYEPWHLRYVGTNLAKYLNKNNLTLEEYYEIKE